MDYSQHRKKKDTHTLDKEIQNMFRYPFQSVKYETGQRDLDLLFRSHRENLGFIYAHCLLLALTSDKSAI